MKRRIALPSLSVWTKLPPMVREAIEESNVTWTEGTLILTNKNKWWLVNMTNEYLGLDHYDIIPLDGPKEKKSMRSPDWMTYNEVVKRLNILEDGIQKVIVK